LPASEFILKCLSSLPSPKLHDHAAARAAFALGFDADFRRVAGLIVFGASICRSRGGARSGT
jgi:hypothetical protein